MVAGRTVRYDKNNELLSWSVVNAVSVINSKKELLIDKKMQRNRIDPVDSVLDGWKCMLLTRATENQQEKDVHTVDDWLDMMEKL